MNVIDCGCASHGDERSVERLIERFSPAELHGFDPLVESPGVPLEYEEGPTRVVLHPVAVWRFDGVLPMIVGETPWERAKSTTLVEREVKGALHAVSCINLANVVRELHGRNPAGGLVLKLDVEGAEYVLLEHLLAERCEAFLDLVLVEWHDLPGEPDAARRRHGIERRAPFRIEEWT